MVKQSSYARTRERLEEIVTQVKAKDIPLEKSLDLYEEALRLGSVCAEMIDRTDFTVEELEGAQEPEAAAVEDAEGDGTEAAAVEDAEGDDAPTELAPATDPGDELAPAPATATGAAPTPATGDTPATAPDELSAHPAEDR
jgi:exodeoxyribonuclease VII small subunit